MEDELTGKKYTVNYRDNLKLYVTVVPGEIFISSLADSKDEKTAAGIDGMTRLLSLCMQNDLKDQAMSQLRKARRTKSDLPSILIKALEDFDNG